MIRHVLILLGVVFLLYVVIFESYSTLQHTAFTQDSPKVEECIEKMRIATMNFVALQREFQDQQTYTAQLRTQNDLMCSDEEWMGNVVIIVNNTESLERWYGIFHIHFLPDGTFKSATSINETAWTPARTIGDWIDDWCGFLKTVYPEDFANSMLCIE